VNGEDPKTVRSIADQFRDVMRTNDDVVEPQLDWNARMPSIGLAVDQDRAPWPRPAGHIADAADADHRAHSDEHP